MKIKKILGYDVYANTTGPARYKHVCALLEQTIDPPTLFPKALDCENQHVLTSPRCRATTCIDTTTSKSITEIPELNEIAFPLHEFCTESTFLKDGSTAVREAFIQAFMGDKLTMSHSLLQKELEFMISLSRRKESPLCISHTFRMKLLELYAKTGNQMFEDPTIIGKEIDPKKHLYEFGEVIQI